MKKDNTYMYEDFYSALEEVMTNGKMNESKGFVQHGDVSVYTHSVMVAIYSYVLADKLKLQCNKKSLVKGALLHDFFLYDWHSVKLSKLHGYNHPHVAAENAKKNYKMTEREVDIVDKHMWPLTLTYLPMHRESWIVCMVDKYCSALETLKINPYENKELYKK